MNYRTPPGFRDVLSEEARLREQTISNAQAYFAENGYALIETPTLESLEVMQRGGGLLNAPFKFFDSQGDLLAMRPDVTLQIMRICATRLKDEAGPFKFRYTQRVFRESETKMQAAARELTQLGIENIGEVGAKADAELISLFAEVLKVCKVEQFTLALATVGVFWELLDKSGASSELKDQILAAYHASNFVELDEILRTDQIDEEYAIALRVLRTIRGGQEAILQVRDLVEPLDCADGLDAFEETYDTLVDQGLGNHLLIDFSVMSSFDYYTGIVVEAYAPGLGAPLGSGGRYDKTMQIYDQNRPAAGFAFYLDRVIEAISKTTDDEDNQKNEGVAIDTTSSISYDRSLLEESVGELVTEQSRKEFAKKPLRIAIPKGSLYKGSVEILEKVGFDVTGLDNPGRQLIIKNPGIEYIIVRPTDAPIFVALGAADCGICGKDSLLEANPDVIELVDLEFGACRFVVAEPVGSRAYAEDYYNRIGSIRVATKYPNITRQYYEKRGVQVEIVKLHGNIELAPLTGMAERIVDITATGTTLKENNLCVVDEVLSSTARFFANNSAFRVDSRVVNLSIALSRKIKE